MSDEVDFKFIKKWECSTTYGYMPAGNARTSGITIGTGFDLGQHSESDLKNMGFTKELQKKLKPYLGKTKDDAKALLSTDKKKPQPKAIKCGEESSAWILVHADSKSALTLTDAEIKELDKGVKDKKLKRVIDNFDSAAAKKKTKKFSKLPTEIQTAVASFCWQYGENVGKINSKTDRRRKFWEAVTDNDWSEAKRILKTEFTKNDKKRRGEEIKLFEKHIVIETEDKKSNTQSAKPADSKK